MKQLKSISHVNILISVFTILFMYSCDNYEDKSPKKPNKTVINQSVYVNYATSGNISCESHISIQFSRDIELVKNDGGVVKESVLNFKPEISGKLYWKNRTTLEFIPDKKLKNGKSYKGVVDLSKLFQLPENQDRFFTFYFNAFPLRINMMTENPKVYVENKKQFISLEGKMQFSDAVNYDEAIKVLKAFQDGEELHIEYPTYITSNTLTYNIKGIQRSDKQGKVVLKWDGKIIESPDSGEKEIQIPAKGAFKYTGIRVIETPSQYVEISFSDPLDESIDLNGLITINGLKNLKYDINTNKVLIYPSSHQSGNNEVVINKELKNIDGKHLNEAKKISIHFGQLKPDIRFIDDGVILPGDDKWLLTFEAVNLSKVDVIVHEIFADNVKQFMQVNDINGNYQLNRVARKVYSDQLDLVPNKDANLGDWEAFEIDLAKLIDVSEKGIYRVQLKFKKEYSLYDCKDAAPNRDDEYSYYSTGDYYNDEYYYPEGYHWNDRDNPCSVSFYYYERFIAKNVVPTNIALLAKGNSDSGYEIFAADLKSTEPIANLKISVFDYQQQLIEEVYTDSRGHAKIAKENDPWLLVAKRGSEYSYLKVRDANSLSYSRFDTKGVTVRDGIKAFMYGDRGVWRPGDTLFLTMIVDDDQKKVPANHPASVKLYNPNSKLIDEQTNPENVNGFYTFALKTSTEDLTGVWLAKFRYGGSEFTKRIRIENIKPNRLKINLTFKDEILKSGKNNADFNVKWLHGGDAENLKASIDASVRPMKTTFEGYETYNFDDIGRYFTPDDVQVFDGELNAKGEKNLDIVFPEYNRAPGELKVSLVSRVYEKGGDFSIDQTNMVYSPYDYYIGLQEPENESGKDYMEVDKPHKFKVVTLDTKGNKIDVENLNVEVYRISWSWWYGSGGRYSSRYINKEYHNLVYQSRVSTVDGKAEFDLKVDYPDWGRFYVNVFDPRDGHSTGSIIYLDWPYWYSRANRKGAGEASLLSLTTDKEKYNVGDTVKVSLPTAAKSNMLVSLESSDRLVKFWWQQADSDESLIKFVATKDMSPNIYLYVSVIQPYGENVNDIPIRRYGLVPILVDDQSTILDPQIKMVESIRPNTDYTIEVSEKNNRKMTYTIAVVDEGLLDLTHFKTPDPHSSFYSKEALFVETWDMYDYVMAAYKGKIKNSFSIGGSDDIIDNSPEKKKANRFKPVVSFIGPFTLENGKNAIHKLHMQNYIGSVKVMLVAGNEGAYGNTHKNVKVKQPLMVLATLPRILAPEEKLKIPVSVFVMDDKISEFNVKLISNEMFKCEENIKTMSVDKQGEKDVSFDVEVFDQPGIGKLKFEVKSGSETAYYETEIEVRNPNPRVYDVNYLVVEGGKTVTYKPEFTGQKGTFAFNINVSKMPQINLDSRLKYLIRYPYGCIEQTTSSVFPQLFLDDLTTLSERQKKQTERNISFAINKISRMQKVNGGFTYWPGSRTASDWGSTYAGHFLLMAKEKGYLVSYSMLENWSGYQSNVANNWQAVYRSAKLRNDLEQAYRLFTLALAGKPEMGAMNRLKEMKGRNTAATYQLAAAYALAGQKAIAEKLIQDLKYDEPDYSYWHYNYGSSLRDKSMIINALVYIDRTKAMPLVKEVAELLSSSYWYSTQTTAFALNALSTFYITSVDDELPSFKYEWNSKISEEIELDKPIYSSDLDAAVGKEISISNTGKNGVYVTLTTSGIQKLDEFEESESNLLMEIVYKNMKGEVIDAKSLKQGADFYAEVKVKNVSVYSRLNNMALSQIFPSGWEIINTRLFDLGSELKSSSVDYFDFRDDRVDFFFSLNHNETKKFIVLLNAAYKGEFFLPSTLCSDMYNNDIKAVKGGGWVKVY